MRAMTWVGLVMLGCGNQPAPVTPGGSATGPTISDSRSPIEKRRDAACKALGPRVTQCAVEDSKAAAARGEITQKQLAEITVPEVLAKNSEEFVEKCQVPLSSRQVRVLEVCNHEETQCEPLLACLDHLKNP